MIAHVCCFLFLYSHLWIIKFHISSCSPLILTEVCRDFMNKVMVRSYILHSYRPSLNFSSSFTLWPCTNGFVWTQFLYLWYGTEITVPTFNILRIKLCIWNAYEKTVQCPSWSHFHEKFLKRLKCLAQWGWHVIEL